MGAEWALAALDAVSREAMLFAAIGFLIGGLDDLAVDLAWCWTARVRRARAVPALLDAYAPTPRRIAVFVAAWDEAEVIGAMLRATLARIDHPDYRLYVGTYPNDRATIVAGQKLSDKNSAAAVSAAAD